MAEISWAGSRRLGFAFSGGLLMGITTAPVSAWPLAWVALVPLWVLVVDGNPIPNSKSHITYSLAWGIAYHGLALSWITGIHPMTWMGIPWLISLLIALFCWIFVALWGAALVTAWTWGMAIICRKYPTWVRILAGVSMWCGLESFWSNGPLYWTSISYTQSPHNLAILHLGQISGPSAVTAALVTVNGLIAEGWVKSQKSRMPLSVRSFLLPITCCFVLHAVGFWLYSRPLIQPPETALKVGIIQGNVPNEIKLYSEGWYRAVEGYTAGYESLAAQGVDAILTPEVALPFLWTDPSRVRNSFYQAVRKWGIVAWLGAYGTQEVEQGLPPALTTSLFTITKNGEIFSRYDKVHLVPLGESLPFEKSLARLRLSPNKALMVAGKPNQQFDTPFGRAIVGVCFDSAFPEHFRTQAAAGGEFILTSSNDAHYSWAMPTQHHAQDVMRAIETNRWTVRATNTGYSAIVDPHGRTQWQSKLNTYELHAATIYRRQNQTLYIRRGDWLTFVLFLSSGFVWFFNFYRTHKTFSFSQKGVG